MEPENRGSHPDIGRDFFNAHDQSDVEITTRERLIMAWESTMDLAKNFKRNSVIDQNDPAGALFAEIAEAQGVCAAKLHDHLKYRESGGNRMQ